ncbi:glutamine-hydrolyzing carbamoyl-phosphate synthase small subunit [bacterium]|nr:glutamine-hydrolyzing carbamoyl-phosphate synthase small subunit [bacterium]
MSSFDSRKGYFLFEDGTRFEADRFYGKAPVTGEAVFNTSHSGYQEILSDPSYQRQILVFTTPHIGNVGINDEDMESTAYRSPGFVCRSVTDQPSNWRSSVSLIDKYTEEGGSLLSGIDTRALTFYIREQGAMRAGVFPADYSQKDALELVLSSPKMEGLELVSEVSRDKIEVYKSHSFESSWHTSSKSGEGLRVGVLDVGVKQNIIRELQKFGCEVVVFPASTSSEEILTHKLNGILISNGPGDPAVVTKAIQTVAELFEKLPMFGICLGHQIMCLAAGMTTFKLKFGHRGANHPVRREADGRVEISSQNHGFAVSSEGFPSEWNISHINLNDQTIEGVEHHELPLFTIQYHPEASPGPHDGLDYFDRFMRNMRNA